jgi:hypothetical protein
MLPMPPPPTLAERLAFLVRWMIEGIALQYIGGPLGGRVPRPLISPLMERLQKFRDRLNRLAERIIAGTYVPRRYVPRRPQANPRPWRESPLRTFGWLADVLPPALAQQHRGHVLALVRDPEIAALIAVAPAEMGRLLRPLCWMVKLKAPPILARPKRQPEAGPPPPPPKYQPPPPRPAPPPAPPSGTPWQPAIQFLPMRPKPKTA